eukprot:gene8728-10349_t
MVLSTISFSELAIEEFDDAAFNASFRSNFSIQMAAAGQVPVEDVRIAAIIAGSTQVASAVYFYPTTGGEEEQSTLAEAFVHTVNNTPGVIFDFSEFQLFGNISSDNLVFIFEVYAYGGAMVVGALVVLIVRYKQTRTLRESPITVRRNVCKNGLPLEVFDASLEITVNPLSTVGDLPSFSQPTRHVSKRQRMTALRATHVLANLLVRNNALFKDDETNTIDVSLDDPTHDIWNLVPEGPRGSAQKSVQMLSNLLVRNPLHVNVNPGTDEQS